ncbi:MAG: hypothetical protein BWY89_01418 [Bacteroidetes bacterium ADurb.BinA012]|nr:MAG: hypothetical protein BWY89_01418 [Bacteroidetes bacterium ADurb.BinA012]
MSPVQLEPSSSMLSVKSARRWSERGPVTGSMESDILLRNLLTASLLKWSITGPLAPGAPLITCMKPVTFTSA